MSRRDFSTLQPLLRWAELALLVVFVTGSLMLVNYIAQRHTTRIDLTPEKRYTLAEQTRKVLATLTSPLRITVFSRQQELRELKDLLELFSRASDKFTFELLDLEKNPARADALGVQGYGAGIMEYEGRREKLHSISEEGILTSILKLTQNIEKTIRFVRGHGEKNIYSTDAKSSYSQIAQDLKAENYRVEELLLLQAKKVPPDTQVLIVAGPEKDLLQSEIDMIDAYLKNGGRILLLCDPFPLPAVEAWLEKLGIGIARDYLIDMQSRLMSFDHLTPIIIPDKRHPIARNMNEAVIFPVCRSVSPLKRTGLTVLARSGPESWAESDTGSVRTNTVSFTPGKDMRGPVPVAVLTAIAGTNPATSAPVEGRLIAMGNSAFATNYYLKILGNKDFFLNTVNWLAENSGLLFSRSKTGGAPGEMLFLTEPQSKLVFWSSVVIEPTLVLLIGILVTAWRRFRR